MTPIRFISIVLATLLLSACTTPTQNPPKVYDLVVYGDSSGAVTAAVAAKRQGRSVVLISPVPYLGGMSTNGLGATDFLGKRATFGGIASEFYDAIAKHYGKEFVRSFEPNVGNRVFQNLVASHEIETYFNYQLDRTPGKGVAMDGKHITSITMTNGQTYHGK